MEQNGYIRVVVPLYVVPNRSGTRDTNKKCNSTNLRVSAVSRQELQVLQHCETVMRARGFFRNFHPRQRSLRPRFSSFGTRLTLTRTGQPLGRARLSVTTTDRTPVRHFATNTFQELPAEANIEEELKPGYRQEDFYPVKLGEVFNVRYQVVAKLGCGVGSTAWLCRHLKYSTPFCATKTTRV